MVEPLAVALRVVNKTRAEHMDSITILGAGTIGLLCLSAAKAVGIGEIIISVKYNHQSEMAKRLGAHHVIQIPKQNIEKEVKAITGNFGVDAVIETVGSSKAFNEALAITRAAGTICLVSGYTDSLDVNLSPIVGNELQLVGSCCYGYSGGRKDFDIAIKLITSGKVKPTSLVTHRFPLEQIEEAFRVAADKTTGSIKVLVIQPE